MKSTEDNSLQHVPIATQETESVSEQILNWFGNDYVRMHSYMVKKEKWVEKRIASMLDC